MTKLLIFIFCLSSVWLYGQDVRVSLKASKTEVAVGEQFSIVLSANIKGSGDVLVPSELEVLARMNGSSSQFVYGKQSYEITQTLTIVATQKGTFTVPPVIWKYGANKSSKSNTLKIVVKAGTDSSTGHPIDNLNQRMGKHFGIFSTTKKEVYVGEPFAITGKIYFDGQIIDANSYKAYEGNLMTHKTDLIENGGNTGVSREEYGGKIYETLLLFDELIVVQEAGKMNFDAFSLNVGYQTGFFSKAFQYITSNALQIVVLPLPDAAPNGFQGAIGDFEFRVSNDIKGELNRGDVFTYKVRVEGSGNLHILKPLTLNLPQGLALYGDPKVDNQVFTSRNGAHGHIDYEFIVQVKEVGEYDFHPIEFSYFDPEKGKYETVGIPKVSFNAVGSGRTIQNANDQSLIEAASDTSWLKTMFIVLLVALLIAVGSVYFLRKNRKNVVQKVIQKPKVDARAIALKSLQAARSTDASETANALEKIILQYFRDLTQNDELLLDKVWFNEQAVHFNISSDLAATWSQHFDKIQAIKYAGFSEGSADDLVEKTKELVEF